MNNPLTLGGIVAGLLNAGGQAWRAVRQMRSRLVLSIRQRRERAGAIPFPLVTHSGTVPLMSWGQPVVWVCLNPLIRGAQFLRIAAAGFSGRKRRN
jgi:hypothetical protein